MDQGETTHRTPGVHKCTKLCVYAVFYKFLFYVHALLIIVHIAPPHQPTPSTPMPPQSCFLKDDLSFEGLIL